MGTPPNTCVWKQNKTKQTVNPTKYWIWTISVQADIGGSLDLFIRRVRRNIRQPHDCFLQNPLTRPVKQHPSNGFCTFPSCLCYDTVLGEPEVVWSLFTHKIMDGILHVLFEGWICRDRCYSLNATISEFISPKCYLFLPLLASRMGTENGCHGDGMWCCFIFSLSLPQHKSCSQSAPWRAVRLPLGEGWRIRMSPASRRVLLQSMPYPLWRNAWFWSQGKGSTHGAWSISFYWKQALEYWECGACRGMAETHPTSSQWPELGQFEQRHK